MELEISLRKMHKTWMRVTVPRITIRSAACVIVAVKPRGLDVRKHNKIVTTCEKSIWNKSRV